MSKVFDVDFKRLVALLLPTFLRKPLLFALLRATVRPLISVHTAFQASRHDALYKANHNGQVCSLRGMLNDAFDPDLRRIKIKDAEALGWCILYKKEAFTDEFGKQPVFVSCGVRRGKTIVFKDKGYRRIPKQGAIGATGADFSVMVPMALRDKVDESRIVSLVNYYKLASKRYSIQYYD